MKNFFKIIGVSITRHVRNIKRTFDELTRTKKIAVSILTLVFAGVVAHSLLSTKTTDADQEKAPREVALSLIEDIRDGDTSLPLLGTVTSTNEAKIRSESSGKLTRVYKKLGDYVSAGTVIAEFENSAERAALLQAEGAYDQAKAARDIARINTNTTNNSLSDVQTSALNAISSAYVVMDDGVRVKTDQVYSNPRTADAKIILSVPDAALTLSLEAKRKDIEKLLIARDARNRTLTTTNDLLNELTQVQSEAQTIKVYLDDLAQAYAKAIPDTMFSQTSIDAGKVLLGVARTSIGGTISTLVASKTALSNSIAAQEIAGKTSGDNSTGVATADATVKQALGAYNGALSRLEKTVIRSPISGTLNSLTIKTGDFIPSFTEIGVVSNNGALEVVAYVTEDDAKRVVTGSAVSINSETKGVITHVASAIDPTTKKIEVRIGITEGKDKLVNGQSVRVQILQDSTKRTSLATTTGPIAIPLSALKITPKGNYLFTVDASSTVVGIPVTPGALLGDTIEILSGVTKDTMIIVDARGLKEGMTVTVKK